MGDISAVSSNGLIQQGASLGKEMGSERRTRTAHRGCEQPRWKKVSCLISLKDFLTCAMICCNMKHTAAQPPLLVQVSYLAHTLPPEPTSCLRASRGIEGPVKGHPEEATGSIQQWEHSPGYCPLEAVSQPHRKRVHLGLLEIRSLGTIPDPEFNLPTKTPS